MIDDYYSGFNIADKTGTIMAAVYHVYCKISNIKGTKSQNLNVSRLILQLSLPNPMKPGVKSRMKM